MLLEYNDADVSTCSTTEHIQTAIIVIIITNIIIIISFITVNLMYVRFHGHFVTSFITNDC